MRKARDAARADAGIDMPPPSSTNAADEDDDDDSPTLDKQYTFSGCNKKPLELLPFGFGSRLGVLCTRRRAVDMVHAATSTHSVALAPAMLRVVAVAAAALAAAQVAAAARHSPVCMHHAQGVIDMLRPLSEAGVRPERFASIMLELASKRYHRRGIQREQDLRAKRQCDPEVGLGHFLVR